MLVHKIKVVVCFRLLRFILYRSIFDDGVVPSDAMLISLLAPKTYLYDFDAARFAWIVNIQIHLQRGLISFLSIKMNIAKLVP